MYPDTGRLEDLNEPTPKRYVKARDLFRRGLAEYDKAKLMTDEAVALIAEAVLVEFRAVNFKDIYSRIDDDNKDQGGVLYGIGERVLLADATPDKPPKDETEPEVLAMMYSAVFTACVGRHFIGMLTGYGPRAVQDYKEYVDRCTHMDRGASLAATAWCPSDPRVWRFLASHWITNGEPEKALRAYERSIDVARELPEDDPRAENWFAGLYTLATIVDNLSPDKGKQQVRDRERVLKLLDEFIEKAPDCHYFMSKACFWRSSGWVMLRASSSGTSPAEIARSCPEEVALSARLFLRGQQGLAYQRRHFPGQATSPQQAEATHLQRVFFELGAVDSVPRVPRQCWGPDCDNNAANACSRCRVAQYCSPSCQRAHWKEEHKAECPRLLKAREKEEAVDRETEEFSQRDFEERVRAQGKDPEEYMRASIISNKHKVKNKQSE